MCVGWNEDNTCEHTNGCHQPNETKQHTPIIHNSLTTHPPYPPPQKKSVLAGVRASDRLHHKALGKVLSAPMRYFDTTPLGSLVQRFSSDLDQVGGCWNHRNKKRMGPIRLDYPWLVLSGQYPPTTPLQNTHTHKQTGGPATPRHPGDVHHLRAANPGGHGRRPHRHPGVRPRRLSPLLGTQYLYLYIYVCMCVYLYGRRLLTATPAFALAVVPLCWVRILRAVDWMNV